MRRFPIKRITCISTHIIMCAWYHILKRSIAANPAENNYTPKYNNTVITVPALL